LQSATPITSSPLPLQGGGGSIAMHSFVLIQWVIHHQDQV